MILPQTPAANPGNRLSGGPSLPKLRIGLVYATTDTNQVLDHAALRLRLPDHWQGEITFIVTRRDCGRRMRGIRNEVPLDIGAQLFLDC